MRYETEIRISSLLLFPGEDRSGRGHDGPRGGAGGDPGVQAVPGGGGRVKGDRQQSNAVVLTRNVIYKKEGVRNILRLNFFSLKNLLWSTLTAREDYYKNDTKAEWPGWLFPDRN